MKYIFVLSLLFKKYNRSLKIRLFSNDIFIDELELSNDIDLKDTDRSKTSIKYRKFNELKFYYQSKEPPEKKILQYPEKIFIYEIDESVLKDELRIEINDKNSDYTNGFMTKSNLIRIEELFLFPADLFFSNKIKKIFKMCNNNLEALDKKTPFTSDFKKKLIRWPGSSGVSNENTFESRFWYGGEKKLRLPLFKKFNTYTLWPRKNDEIKYPTHWWFNPEFLEYDEIYGILNTIDENQ